MRRCINIVKLVVVWVVENRRGIFRDFGFDGGDGKGCFGCRGKVEGEGVSTSNLPHQY